MCSSLDLQFGEKQKQEPADPDENTRQHDNHTHMGEMTAHFFPSLLPREVTELLVPAASGDGVWG